jgi:hypothetical protein
VRRLKRREVYTREVRPPTVKMSMSSDCIPEFAPGRPNQSTAKWVNKIDQLARINHWDENTIVQLMQNRLTGLARTWYDNLTDYTYTWSEWKALLVRTFPEHRDFADTFRRAIEREKLPNETMTQYYFGKMNLLQACKISGKEAVSCLIDGLADHTIKHGAKAGRFENPEQLYAEYLSTLTTEIRQPQEISERTTWEHKNYSRRFSRPMPRPSRNRTDLRCFNCHKLGHHYRNCYKQKSDV